MSKNKDEFVVAMIVNEKNSCDSIVYGIAENMKMKVLSASGSDDNRRLVGLVGDTGVKHELGRIQSKCNMRSRFLVCCTSDQEICKQIKNQFYKSKVHPLKLDSRKLADGTAFLSYVAVDGCSLECPFDLLNLTSIKQLSSGVSYRLVHTTSNSNMKNLQKLSTQLRRLMDNQLMELSESKAATKQMIVGKMKDLEESRLSRQKKDKFRQLLKNDLKAVDEELMNKGVVENIAENWRKNQFSE
ncbi:hypothetical protein HA402_011948 [Bradysia odoriphaga]|nr:hypothetical protein HA402_011948 [Bradysia odoriphaga]